MLVSKTIMAAEDGMTVERLKDINRKLGGKNYLDMDTGIIVRIEESQYIPASVPTESTASIDLPAPADDKKKGKKK